MQNEVKERATWRLYEGESYIFNGEVWKNRPLPVTIWCPWCYRETKVIEVFYSGSPQEVSGNCLSCGKKVAIKAEFSKPMPVPVISEEPTYGQNRFFGVMLGLAALASHRAVRPGMMPRVPNPLPDSVQEGKEISCDRKLLPLRKEVTIKCDCGGQTESLVVLRNYDAYLDEKKALGPDFTSRIGYLRYAFVYSRLYLSGFCGECRKRVEASIKLD
ncbi:MAG: hypothetical protein WC536_02455 [Patescibacteria group bacterium]